MSVQGIHRKLDFKDTDDVRREYPFLGHKGLCAKCGHVLPSIEVMEAQDAPWPCPECDCGHREVAA